MAAHDEFDVTLINYGGMDAGESDFQKAYNDLVTELNDLEGKLLQKTAIWQGATEQAFHQVRQTWNKQAGEMANIVQLMAKNINITRMNMQDAERVNTGMFDVR
ncbi:WXG100 family type VII secretion target [Streptosporangium sp. NPDC000396]|uniref:WXG100 family type VII secretion target n=1 Tax=Streptosporangium sp. NPDC000396 TaxID=3366185 RepID=UPI0036C7D38B